MSAHGNTYVPKSRLAKWFESRLPIVGLVHSSFVAFPVPRNLTYFWTFGAILIAFLGIQIVTGVWLAMHYEPSAKGAFDSVEHIMRDVNWGWFIRYAHANGASMFFVAVYIHMFRGLYYGSYKAPREVLWILGVIIFLMMMATAFMGYVLPWGQMSFWGATVITNLFSAIPLVGESITTWLWGGYSVDNPTLNRFFSLHYLLPFMLAGVVVLLFGLQGEQIVRQPRAAPDADADVEEADAGQAHADHPRRDRADQPAGAGVECGLAVRAQVARVRVGGGIVHPRASGALGVTAR